MSQYEFSEEHGRVIERVGGKVLILGILMALGGVVGIAIDIARIGTVPTLTSVASTIQSALFLVVGGVLLRPSDNLKRVATTKGKDITELMTALRELNWGTKAVIIVLLVMLILEVVQMF